MCAVYGVAVSVDHRDIREPSPALDLAHVLPGSALRHPSCLVQHQQQSLRLHASSHGPRYISGQSHNQWFGWQELIGNQFQG
jgi:hypothetical protein